MPVELFRRQCATLPKDLLLPHSCCSTGLPDSTSYTSTSDTSTSSTRISDQSSARLLVDFKDVELSE